MPRYTAHPSSVSVFLVGLQKRLLDAVAHQIAVFPGAATCSRLACSSFPAYCRYSDSINASFFFLHRAYAPFALLYGIGASRQNDTPFCDFLYFFDSVCPSLRSARLCRFPASLSSSLLRQMTLLADKKPHVFRGVCALHHRVEGFACPRSRIAPQTAP